VAVIDWYSRKVLSFRISNTLDAVVCVECLEEALKTHGTPEILFWNWSLTQWLFTASWKGYTLKPIEIWALIIVPATCEP